MQQAPILVRVPMATAAPLMHPTPKTPTNRPNAPPAVILLILLFWPLAWLPCVMPDCYSQYQVRPRSMLPSGWSPATVAGGWHFQGFRLARLPASARRGGSTVAACFSGLHVPPLPCMPIEHVCSLHAGNAHAPPSPLGAAAGVRLAAAAPRRLHACQRSRALPARPSHLNIVHVMLC